MKDILQFHDAIEHAKQFTKLHLLLGNGFSIAFQKEIFSYPSLFDRANFSSNPRLRDVFQEVGSTDFEHVIKALENASRIAPIYSDKKSKADNRMADDAAKLKNILIRTVANNHPHSPNEITEEQFYACRKFLYHFLGNKNRNGKVYTLNYDLLLYWTLMHKDINLENPAPPINLATEDGFGRDEDTEPEYVNWMGESAAHGQRVHYLHGALHLCDAGAELQKYTWINTGQRILEQAQEAMKENKFPLFVAEGESRQKITKIKHSAYLYHSYKSFSSQMWMIGDALFIFGHALAENDQHILKKIGRGRIRQIYVSLYGDPSNEMNRNIIENAHALTRLRDERYALDVKFYDAASANVWGQEKT